MTATRQAIIAATAARRALTAVTSSSDADPPAGRTGPAHSTRPAPGSTLARSPAEAGDRAPRRCRGSSGALPGCRAAPPGLRAAPAGGSIVSISSVTGRVGGWGEAVYAGARAAVVAFSTSLAREVVRDGIRVNCVSPAVTRTPFEERLRADPVGARIVEDAVRTTPMRRLGVAEEVAGAVAFLASPSAAFTTGQVLSVNGGAAM